MSLPEGEGIAPEVREKVGGRDALWQYVLFRAQSRDETGLPPPPPALTSVREPRAVLKRSRIFDASKQRQEDSKPDSCNRHAHLPNGPRFQLRRGVTVVQGHPGLVQVQSTESMFVSFGFFLKFWDYRRWSHF